MCIILSRDFVDAVTGNQYSSRGLLLIHRLIAMAYGQIGMIQVKTS